MAVSKENQLKVEIELLTKQVNELTTQLKNKKSLLKQIQDEKELKKFSKLNFRNKLIFILEDAITKCYYRTRRNRMRTLIDMIKSYNGQLLTFNDLNNYLKTKFEHGLTYQWRSMVLNLENKYNTLVNKEN